MCASLGREGSAGRQSIDAVLAGSLANRGPVELLAAHMFLLSDMIRSEDFGPSDKNFRNIKLPNKLEFFDDDRAVAETPLRRKGSVGQSNCLPGEKRR